MGDCDEYYPVVDAEPVRALEDRTCDRSVQLSGPKSPLESEMYSTLVNSSKRCVHIDAHSVNSVILTPLQQVCHGKCRVFGMWNSYKIHRYFSVGLVDQVHGFVTYQPKRWL